MMLALRTWWQPAVGSSELYLTVAPVSLLIGALIAWVLSVTATAWSMHRVARLPAAALLAGQTHRVDWSGGRRRRWRWSHALMLLSVVFIVLAPQAPVPMFFAVGSCLLVTGLVYFSEWCRGGRAPTFVTKQSFLMLRLALGGLARRPGRSTLAMGLIASACFMMVAVAANRREYGHEELKHIASGGGGFEFLAEADVPLYHALDSESGRFELGFSERESATLATSELFGLSLRPGDDASCLNLYRPRIPRILGVPPGFVDRGGFIFHNTLVESTEPWQLLEHELLDGVIPAFGDHETLQWILHLGLGEELQLKDEAGHDVRLKIVGQLSDSIFQSELLVSQANFARLFPSRAGQSVYLIKTPQKNDELVELLETRLADYGFDVSSTAARLASYKVVANTYLSTFQTLGGLGLLLGTLGQAIVLIRSVVERRGELATLRAFGYRQSTLARMVGLESVLLLLLGVTLGSVSALIGVAPLVSGASRSLPWLSLAKTLGLVMMVGLGVSGLAARMAMKAPLLSTLKRETP